MSDRKLKRPSFAEMFTPKLVTFLREGYGFGDFRADAIAGLTVAIVALPLSMAIAMPAVSVRSEVFTPQSSAAFWCRRWAEAAFRLAVPPAPSSSLYSRSSNATATKGWCWPR